MLKRSLLVAATLAILAGPAFASSCPKLMKAIDEALAKNPNLTAAQMTEVKELRAKGEALHKAGEHADSIKALTEAEKILGIAN